MRHRISMISAVIITLAVVMVTAGGCEERVVGVDTGWGRPPVVRQDPRSAARREGDKPGFFESLGEALFGWMKSDDAESKTSRPAFRTVDPDSRQRVIAVERSSTAE